MNYVRDRRRILGEDGVQVMECKSINEAKRQSAMLTKAGHKVRLAQAVKLALVPELPKTGT